MNYEVDRGVLIYNGIDTRDFGVWLSGSGTYDAPARYYTSVVIPGRNGTLTVDSGAFEEVDHIYPAFIPENFNANIEGLRNLLLANPGYHRLEDGYHPEEYYLAKFMDGLSVDVAPRAIGGSFSMKFRRDPRRFLRSGELSVPILNGGHIDNPTSFPSKPVIEVTGYGQLTIGSQVITITNQYASIIIDCEMMDCYSGTYNANAYVTFAGNDFPVLNPGQNNITFANTITALKITPHWWRV